MIRQPYDLDLAREHQREIRALAAFTSAAPGPAISGERSRLLTSADGRAVRPVRVARRSTIPRPSIRRSPGRRLNRIARRLERVVLGAAMELVAAVLERRIVRACVAERDVSRAAAAGRA